MSGTFPESIATLRDRVVSLEQNLSETRQTLGGAVEECNRTLKQFVEQYEHNHQARLQWQKGLTDGVKELQSQRDKIIIGGEILKKFFAIVAALVDFAAAVKTIWPLH